MKILQHINYIKFISFTEVGGMGPEAGASTQCQWAWLPRGGKLPGGSGTWVYPGELGTQKWGVGCQEVFLGH